MRAFGDAFSGTAAIHYAAIAGRPWTRRFAVTLQDAATSPGGAVDSAKVDVNSGEGDVLVATMKQDRSDSSNPSEHRHDRGRATAPYA